MTTAVLRQKSAESRSSSRPSIEYYMRPESRMSSIPKIKQDNDESRAQFGWRLIRQCVRQAIDVSLKADTKDLYVNHGIHHHKKIMHIDPIEQMVYNKNTNEYITVDGKILRIFHPDGRKKEVVTPQESFNRLLYASGIGLYVGWTKDENTLLLMNDEFEVQSRSESEQPILSAVYNENIGEVVTTGTGCLTSWVFRYGGRHILPRKNCSEGLTEKDKFHLVVLEETISRTQKAYAACGSAVAVFNLFHGELLTYKKELHVRKITALLFFNPLKYLITAAKDGSIKVWDDKWHLQLVFVGHSGPVTSLAIYPFGPNIISSSLDKTIRVWSLETCDEVDVCESGDPVACLSTMINHDKFFTHSHNHADLWKVQNIHMLHTRIGHRLQKVKTTDHPEHPVRSVLLCKDASVRVISPVSGEVLTTLLEQPKRILVDAAYAIEENLLFACYVNGDIVRANTSTNPCTVTAEWKCYNQNKACNYLLVYEYVITADVGSDMWGGIKRMAATKGRLAIESTTPSTNASARSTPQPIVPRSDSPNKLNANRTLLLGGRKDGHICVFNMDTGETEFEIEAHGTFGVLSMIANSKADQLISAGLDNLIKIWRLYPYAQESLAPLMTLYCAHTPTFMCILKNKLAVAFQEHSTATYSVVMYSLKGRNRFDHSPDNDHMDSIVGLSSCPKLKIVASASHDGTIKIWNEVNSLIRIIKLNAKPYSLSFCSEKGDLLVGIAEHAHKIDYKHYMPKAYRFKMISISFREQLSEKAIEFDENLVNMLSKEDQKRLKAARSSFKFTHFVDILTEDETEEVLKEKKVRESAFNSLLSRDEELLKIKDGLVSASRKPKTTPATKREGFEKYLKIFYNRPKINLFQGDLFSEDTAKEIVAGPKSKKEAVYQVEKEPTGFFPAPPAAKRAVTKEKSLLSIGTQPKTPSSPIRSDGFIPNSVLVKLLFPKETSGLEKEPTKDIWRPKQMTNEQLNQIESMKTKKIHSDSMLSIDELGDQLQHSKSDIKKLGKEGTERILVMDYSDDEDEETEEEKMAKEQKKAEEEEAQKEKDFLSRMQSLVDKVPTPPLDETVLERLEIESTHSSTKGVSPMPIKDSVLVPSASASSKAATAAKPKPAPTSAKPFVKYVSTFKTAPHPPSSTGPPESAASTRPESSTIQSRPQSPPRPKTPLPDFISQFKGMEWFDKYFPNANENTFPKPWNVAAFVTMIVRVLRIADFKLKIDVLDALLMLHLQEGILNPEPVYKVIYSIFNHHSHPPTCLNEDEKAFIRKGLELLQVLGVYDREFFIEHIVQFLEGEKEIRAQVSENLQVCGLRDPQKYFIKELDSWDVWNLDEKDRQGELRRMCKDWLERWLTSFKIHIQDAIDRMKRGQSVVGRATPNQVQRTSPAPPQTSKGILKKPAMPGLIEEGDEEESVAGTTHKTPSSRAATTTGPVSVTFDKPPDASAVENATYIEAINYFCDMELEKAMDAIKNGGRVIGEKGTDDKNTVLVLPKIPGKSVLVRLGETHTSKCKPSRETSLSVDMRLPPITARGHQPPPGQLYGFPPCIQLPMKPVVMNPFPGYADEFDPLYTLHQPVLLMLKTSQKYFVHERSYIPPDMIGEVS